MATTTTNYGLTKPSYGDNADIAVINSNMDKIDTKMKEIEDAGGSGASTWAEVADKPFETVGSGLSVDESGALNATGGGSGSSVSWNQIQTSGSKIAEVTIDGKKTNVYAPNSGGGGTLDIDVSHNIPRITPKDITDYYNDGTIWKRLNGTDGFSKYEDLFVGDYFQMSRPISAYNKDQNYQETGSDWVTIAGISTLYGNGDSDVISYEHLVMVPGKGFGGTQHFGKGRMNSSNTTTGGYASSEMHTITIGGIATSGSTEITATINQQLYAEFGTHLKTTRESLSNALKSTGYNRLGENSGCSGGRGWFDCQAVLMSEIEVFGTIVCSSSVFDTGTGNKQLPLFENSKQARNNRSGWYWEKDVASASQFCHSDDYGYASFTDADNAEGDVRPRFVIA